MATYWENSCSFGLRYVSWYKYLIVSLVFSHLGFWSGNLFLIAPFPDLCLLVPFSCISVVGGLISAHLMSKRGGMDLEPGWPCSGPFLRMAENVARRLLPGMSKRLISKGF